MKKSKHIAVLKKPTIYRYKGKHYKLNDGDPLTGLPKKLIEGLVDRKKAKFTGGKNGK